MLLLFFKQYDVCEESNKETAAINQVTGYIERQVMLSEAPYFPFPPTYVLEYADDYERRLLTSWACA